MIDLDRLGQWLVVVGLLIGIPLLAKPFARGVSRRLIRLGALAVDRLRPAPEFDQLADDLSLVVRRGKLHADIRRLQRILATDMSMSATRQMGNRLAYAWLLRELERIRDPWQPTLNDGAINSWNDSALPIQRRDLRSSHDSQRAPNVEILDIRWKR